MLFSLGLDKVIREGVHEFATTRWWFIGDQMVHSEWGNRITFEDFPLPTLIFISGLTIPLALKKYEKSSWKNKARIIFKRVVILLLISMIYNASINRMLGSNSLTVAGVLSVFAVAWGGSTCLFFGYKSM